MPVVGFCVQVCQKSSYKRGNFFKHFLLNLFRPTQIQNNLYCVSLNELNFNLIFVFFTTFIRLKSAYKAKGLSFQIWSKCRYLCQKGSDFEQRCESASLWCRSESLFYCDEDQNPTLMRIPDQLFTSLRIRILLLIKSDASLRPLVDPLRLHFWASTPPIGASMTLHNSILSPKLLIFDLMRIRILLFTLMRIRNRLPKMVRIHADPQSRIWGSNFLLYGW